MSIECSAKPIIALFGTKNKLYIHKNDKKTYKCQKNASVNCGFKEKGLNLHTVKIRMKTIPNSYEKENPVHH